MPVGIEIWDMATNLILGVTDRTDKLLGEVSLPATGASSASGTVTDAGLAQGEFWWLTTLPPTTEYSRDVRVSLSGTTLTWTVGANCPACTLYYGWS